ncbi:tegument protein UL37 [Panine betaherpesvirus 2]|uniref:Tegument protein UL37 n=1 Tax=Panine betaherpesvirus 2 TaxID=188763 RepID=Q8QS42_9BETA|nr:tegument protein UL37 [Panine betaherpesvirus 2]AAM00696.1 tegument protein UL37 [Panine betaherpesvirus 2]QXV67801.1 tegument protein UL37 [Panine betaherpesvirus 2]
MSKRTVDLKKLVDQLRHGAAGSQETLNILSRVEIGALDALEVNVGLLRAFVSALQNVSGYHFGFVRNHTVFYVLSHATLQAARQPLDAAQHLYDHLEKFVARDSGAAAGSELEVYDNTKTLDAFKKLIEAVRELFTIVESQHPFPASGAAGVSSEKRAKKDGSGGGPGGDRGSQALVRQTLARLEELRRQVEPYLNCRAVAELVDMAYQHVTYWACTLMFYTAFRKDTDTALDRVLLMYYFYTHYGPVNGDVAAEFQEYVRNARSLKAFLVSDVDADQQPGAEQIRDVSYRLFTGSLQQRDSTGLTFPVISTKPSVVSNHHLTPERLFFHPGLVTRLLSEEVSSTQASRQRLEPLQTVCARIIDRYFASQLKVTKMQDLIDVAHDLVGLGFNYNTCSAYAQTALMQPANLRSPLFVDETKNQLIMIIYNAYMFFLCLYVYSPTFFFEHRRRQILEQNQSTLVGSREELHGIWETVLLNVRAYFPLRYTEEQFEAHTRGTTNAEREYLYRDLSIKWGTMLFVLRPRGGPGGGAGRTTPLPSLDGVTRNDIVRQCGMLRLSDGPVSYEPLLAFSSHQDFPQVFAQLVLVPQFSEIFGIPQGQFETVGSPRLMTLIQLCRILMPDQVTLYQNLVSIYNLTHFVRQVDASVFKTVRDCTLEIAVILSQLSGETVKPNIDLLVQLMLQSLSHNLATTVDPVIRDITRSSSGSLQNFIRHTRLCYCLALSRAHLSKDMQTVYLEIESRHLHLPTARFLQQLKDLIRADKLLSDSMRHLSERLQVIRTRVKQVTQDTEEISRYSRGHPSTTEMGRSLKKMTTQLRQLETRVQNSLQGAQRSNGRVIASLERVLKTFEVLSTQNLERQGLTLCLTEAAGLVQEARSFQPFPVTGTAAGSGVDAEKTLRDFFEGPWEGAAEPRRLSMTTTTDSEQMPPFPDVMGDRYDPQNPIGDLLNWYIVSVDQAQRDIFSSIDPPAGHASPVPRTPQP